MQNSGTAPTVSNERDEMQLLPRDEAGGRVEETREPQDYRDDSEEGQKEGFVGEWWPKGSTFRGRRGHQCSLVGTSSSSSRGKGNGKGSNPLGIRSDRGEQMDEGKLGCSRAKGLGDDKPFCCWRDE